MAEALAGAAAREEDATQMEHHSEIVCMCVR